MDKSRNLKQNGQTLVIVALLLVGLLALLGLVLDGGNMYFQRRQAQLAADAGALAAARAYCLTESEDAAINSGYDYAVNRNGVDNADVTVDGETGYVTVDTDLTFDAFFMGMFGNPLLSVSASATAVCSPPKTGIGVLPIAWSCDLPIGSEPSDFEECDLLLMDHYEKENGGTGDGKCVYGEDPYYIVVDNTKIEEDIMCMGDTPPSENEEDVRFVQCDIDGDGVNDFEIISNGNRSWLDLDGGGGGASHLIDWIDGDATSTIEIHTWFAGQPGAEVVVYKAIEEWQLGNDVVIPVFDAYWFCDGLPAASPINECSEALWHAGEDTVVKTGGVSKDYFHVISFAKFHIECVEGLGGTAGNCPANEYLKDLYKDIHNPVSVEGCFVEGFSPGLGGGEGEFDVGALVVHLVE